MNRAMVNILFANPIVIISDWLKAIEEFSYRMIALNIGGFFAQKAGQIGVNSKWYDE